ncbi:multidrug effflux MFS transporter [Octadecabacter sp. SW4]|uniref:multidrug effflux MFS transporter n=1 Tax=Octadecabacter sp. SW4 TaxID=2602067 RepID=UPI0011C1E82A|nr:multidrug effflux MFS transporter [Octadecabacter sp. SW4]QEE35949.1 multidrug effflux MFS transporter [Octadecabacter sp. SW4]
MLRFALILGLLSAVGPFAIDMYLPGMPMIEGDLDASVAATQMTLTAYFIVFGLAQLVYGPWSDQVGRKPPLYLGLGIFAFATVGCALSPTIGWLIAFRAMQGLGGAVLMVVPRAIIRDRYTGVEGTKLMAMVMLVISVSPMLAPLAGSGLLLVGGWRLLFWAMFAAAGASLLVTAFAFRETLTPSLRVAINFMNLRRGARVLLRDPVFMGLTMIGGFGMASFFVFLANAAFVYTDQFGLTPTGFSVAFAVNAIGFFSASQAAGPLGARFGMVAVMRSAIFGFAAIAAALTLVVALGGGTLYVIVAGLALANACLGLVIPTTMVMALDDHGDIAGLASSLGGTLQMLVGGVMMVLSAQFFDGTALPMVAAITFCALAALALSVWIMGRIGQSAQAS